MHGRSSDPLCRPQTLQSSCGPGRRSVLKRQCEVPDTVTFSRMPGQEGLHPHPLSTCRHNSQFPSHLPSRSGTVFHHALRDMVPHLPRNRYAPSRSPVWSAAPVPSSAYMRSPSSQYKDWKSCVRRSPSPPRRNTTPRGVQIPLHQVKNLQKKIHHHHCAAFFPFPPRYL